MNKVAYKNCFCLWEDLLGFGQAFYNSNWDIVNDEKALENLSRISRLSFDINHTSNVALETMFALNDGFARNFDVPDNVLNILTWLEDTLLSFWYINNNDISNGFFGVRGVLAKGVRIKYLNDDFVKRSDHLFTLDKRIKESIKDKIMIYTPNEFQMNTAFSKAYIIENSGSAMGVHGPKLYIDYEVIKELVLLINKSEPEKLFLVEGDITIKFTSSFENNVFYVYATREIDNETYEFMSVTFDENIVDYNNHRASIDTNLLVPIRIKSVISCQEPFELTSYIK